MPFGPLVFDIDFNMADFYDPVPTNPLKVISDDCRENVKLVITIM